MKKLIGKIKKNWEKIIQIIAGFVVLLLFIYGMISLFRDKLSPSFYEFDGIDAPFGLKEY